MKQVIEDRRRVDQAVDAIENSAVSRNELARILGAEQPPAIDTAAGELDGGASLEEVAEDFGLDLDAVRWAQSYELSQRAAA